MESRDIFEDGEWRCACGESANIPTHTTLQNERDEARARNERWKQAVQEYHLHVIKNYNSGISLDASEAMRDGNLEALEAALRMHGGKRDLCCGCIVK